MRAAATRLRESVITSGAVDLLPSQGVGFRGTDVFTYYGRDNDGVRSNTATVRFNVTRQPRGVCQVGNEPSEMRGVVSHLLEMAVWLAVLLSALAWVSSGCATGPG